MLSRLAGVSFLLFAAHAAMAQATSGSILGGVLDASRARVPGASVRALNEATGLAQSTQSNALGDYALPALPPGSYTVTVSKQGFASVRRGGLQLAIDQKMRVDFELAPGAVAFTSTVSSESPVLQTQSAETGEVIGSRQIASLPLLGRNFLDLARLTAGVSYGSGGNTLNISVNGQREFANSILVDGVEVSSNRNNDTTLRPSVDSVEEFKVVTSAYAAEFGRAAGAVVAIQTKSGANRVHGDLYEFFRPSGAAAKSFFATEASPLKQHNFGAALGAPLKTDKTFLFGSYEGVRLRNAFSFLDSVPPVGQIRFTPGGSADLSGLKDPFSGGQVPIFDPGFYAANYYASPFPGNVIPANRISPAGKAVLQNFFPAPTAAGIYNGWFSNFASRQAYAYDSSIASGRLDHVFSPEERFSAAYHYGSFTSNTGDRFAGHIPVAGGGDADYGDQEDSRYQELSVSQTSLLSDRWLNEFRFGYTRYRLDQLSLLNGQNLAARYGLGNVNLPGYPSTSGFPSVYLGFGAQTGGSTYKPLYFLDSNSGVSDSVSTHRRRHDLKAGAHFRRLQSRPLFSLFPTGFQYYGGPGVSLTGDPNYSFYDASAFYYNGGSDVADLLLGLPYSVNLGQQLTNPETRSWEGGAYAQDAWQVTPRLALSLGVRYEYAAPWTEAGNQASNLGLAPLRVLLAGRGGNSTSLVTPDRNNFAPRVGLAFRIAPRTVLRAGWGVFYSPENDAREDVLTKNYPYAVQQTAFNDIFGGLPFTYSLDAGVARVLPTPPASTVVSLDPAAIKSAAGAGQNVYMVDSNLRTGYSQLYNFTLQHQAASGITLEAGYVGSVSRKLPYAVGDLNSNQRISSSLGQVQALFSQGSASYQSLQVKASKRFSRNLGFLVAYTFGKNLDNGPAPFNLGHNQNSHNWPQSALNLSLERAAADNDVKHNLVASSSYVLPFGNGQRFLAGLHGWRQQVLGGWQLNGIFVCHSGLPVNVVRNAQMTGFGGLRPDVVSDPNLPQSERTLTRYFNTASFVAARFGGAGKTSLGNAGRNLVRGPGLVNTDFSALKEIALGERLGLETRFEFFNLTNTPHFANPDGNMSDGTFGGITQTAGNPRVIQFGAKLKW
jgi:hypothetical protein